MPKSPIATALALLVAAGIAAPAQAQVTATKIGAPAKTRFVLYDTSAPHPKTIAVAGAAAGSGDVDIVCVRATEVVSLLEDVPVAADGTFAEGDVPLDAAADAANPESPGRSCHLRAVPAGTTPPANDPAFQGPLLGVSKYSQLRVSGGANDGVRAGYYLYAAGTGYSAEAGAFGDTCNLWTVIQDPQTLEPQADGLTCAGTPRDSFDRLDLAIDGQAAYAPAALNSGVAGSGLQGGSSFPELPEPSVQFDEDTGDVSVTETSPFATCAPDNSFPPRPWTCTSFDRVPVEVNRTTSVVGGAQLIRVVERWSSTDGHAHTLDATYDQPSCFGGYDCAEQLEYRFPGEAVYARHDANDATPATAAIAGPLPALEPIFAKDGTANRVGGAVIIPGQRADGARFFGSDEFGIDYTGRTIPATGSLTLTHYYATVSGATVEDGADRLRAWIGQPPAQVVPAPSGAGGAGTVAQAPARPQLSRRGRVRVQRSGRTFAVTTRERVRCPAGGPACELRVSAKARGLIAGTARTLVASGGTAKVTFRLRRSAASALKRLGRLRLTVTVYARAGTGPAVAKRRALAIALPRR